MLNQENVAENITSVCQILHCGDIQQVHQDYHSPSPKMGSDRHTQVYIQQTFYIYIHKTETLYEERTNFKQCQSTNSSWLVCAHVPCAQSCPTASTPWAAAHQARLSTGFPRQEYWSGSPCPHQGDLSNPEIKPTAPVSPALQVDSLPPEPSGKPNLQWSNLWFHPLYQWHKSNMHLVEILLRTVNFYLFLG